MKKIKMKILHIRREPNPKGGTLLRIEAISNGKSFEFGAKEEHYLNDRQRRSIHATVFKRLHNEQVSEVLSEKERDVVKDGNEKKLTALINTEVIEDE